MFLARLIHERNGRLLGFVAAVIILAVSLAVLAIQSQDWQEVLNQLYGLLD
jgi:hypothetical protein